MTRYRGVLTQPYTTVNVSLLPNAETELWLTQPATTGNTTYAGTNNADPTVTATIIGVSTTGFASTGTIFVDCQQRGHVLTIPIVYTGTTSTTFTGCTTSGYTTVDGLTLVTGAQITGNKQVTFVGIAQWTNDPSTSTVANTVDRYHFRSVNGTVYGQHLNVPGPDGSAGAQGPVGVTNHGAFALSGTSYSVGDIVTYNNNSYICTAAVATPASAHLPTDTAYWDCMAGLGTAKIPTGIPAVSSVTPNNGGIAGGTAVTIVGTNFTGTTGVLFGATAGTSVVVVDDTHVTATSPAHAAGLIDVTVTNGFGTSTANTGDHFSFTGASAPTVTSITPTTGLTAGGTAITITGTNLTSSTAVSFGGTAAATFANVNSTTVTATSPAHASGIADVTVTTSVGTSPTNAGDRFTFTAAVPTVTSVVPNNGVQSGATQVTITGTGFTGATAVTFGGAAAISFGINTDTQIIATSPAGAVGLVDVKVTAPAGTSAANAGDQFTYTASQPTTGGVDTALPWDLTYTNRTGGKSANTIVNWLPRSAITGRSASTWTTYKGQGVTGVAYEPSGVDAFLTSWSPDGTGTLNAEQIIIRDNQGGVGPVPSVLHAAGMPIYCRTLFANYNTGLDKYRFGIDWFDNNAWGAAVPSSGANATPGSALRNLQNYAAMVKLYGFDGFLWDLEGHNSHADVNTPSGQTTANTRLQAKARGKQMMQAIRQGWGDDTSKHIFYQMGSGGGIDDKVYAVDVDAVEIDVDILNGFTSLNNWGRIAHGNSQWYYGGPSTDIHTGMWYEENGLCARWSHSLDNWNYAAQRISAHASTWPGPTYNTNNSFEAQGIHQPSADQIWFDAQNIWAMQGLYWVFQGVGGCFNGDGLPLRSDGSGLREDITFYQLTGAAGTTYNPNGFTGAPFGPTSYLAAWQGGVVDRTVDPVNPTVTISTAIRSGANVTFTGTANHTPPGNIPQGIRRVAWINATQASQGHAQHNFVTATNPLTASIASVSATWTWTATVPCSSGDVIRFYAESLKGRMSAPAQTNAP